MSVTGISATSQDQSLSSTYFTSVQQDLQNLQQSLQAGNLNNAQQSFAQLLQDYQDPAQGVSAGQNSQGTSLHMHGHHHHHHIASAGAQSGSQAAQSGTTTTASSNDSTNSNQLAANLLAMPASGILPADTALSGDSSTSGIML